MKRLSPWLILLFAGGLLYPLLVYFGAAKIPSMCFVLVGLALIGLRILALRGRPDARPWIAAFLIAALGLIVMLLLDPALAVKAYPVAVSLSVAALFGLSLFHPPSLVERMARIKEPHLPPQGVAYTRKVTLVWTVFLLANALISAATALWGTLAQWTLWNGFISYILMGTLFLGEMLVRRMVQR